MPKKSFSLDKVSYLILRVRYLLQGDTLIPNSGY